MVIKMGVYACKNCATQRKFKSDRKVLYFDCRGCGRRDAHHRMKLEHREYIPKWDMEHRMKTGGDNGESRIN